MELNFVLDKIKRINLSCRPVTNCYSLNNIKKITDFWESEESFAFAFEEHGIKRILFFLMNKSVLEQLFCNVPKGQYCLEFLTKNPQEYYEILNRNGFACLAQMMRMSVRDVAVSIKNNFASQHFDETVGTFPDEGLVQDINKVLWKVFDTRVSHLQDDDELKRSIEKREVLIHQNEEGSVDAVLQTIIQPQRFYINQVYNGADKNVIHSMMHQRLKEYIAAGGKYAYAWVDKNNIASVKFHQKYGLQADGMWNMVYVLKRE